MWIIILLTSPPQQRIQFSADYTLFEVSPVKALELAVLSAYGWEPSDQNCPKKKILILGCPDSDPGLIVDEQLITS
ncbi:hypothetical protein AVEN_66728-1 [Araneus ventricosus]|uniref:Uncharacterized protein n=1 Tax=Araneus ventricosus TaxID=182803 RepID=A0A4Y2JM91_ARAVE|nr:hypothetical protein AVEN_66728-1 [Araneus ventricosus]